MFNLSRNMGCCVNKSVDSLKRSIIYLKTRRLPQLDKSLCGCTLGMGTKISGWILLSYHLLGILFTIYGYHMEMDFLSRYEAGSSDAIKHQEQIIITMVIGAVLMLSVIFDVILLIGAYTNWPKFLLTWIVLEVISVILSFFGVPGLMLEFPPLFGNIPGLSFVTTCYIILIVKSHYQNLTTIAKKTSPVVDA